MKKIYYNDNNVGLINLTSEGGGGGITSGEVQTMIDESISGKADTTALTTHTSDTTIHVTASDKSNWNGKANSATTISGYGITDAYTKTEIDNKIGDIETLLAAI